MNVLSGLRKGDIAIVDSLDLLPDDVAHRMRSLGFHPGAEVVALRRAPLGDPAVYRVCDAEICLRDSEANRIGVVPVP